VRVLVVTICRRVSVKNALRPAPDSISLRLRPAQASHSFLDITVHSDAPPMFARQRTYTTFEERVARPSALPHPVIIDECSTSDTTSDRKSSASQLATSRPP
jgi:hypothetical protein